MGLEGPMWQMVEGVLLLIVCQAGWQGIVIGVPFHLGRLLIAVFDVSQPQSKLLYSALAISVGHLVVWTVVCLVLV